jgi:hypothetical protein
MPDTALDRVLRLVAEGRLTAEEAGPILDALDTREASPTGDETRNGAEGAARSQAPAAGPPRALRVQVRDEGRTVINLRIPLSLGRALNQVPGVTDAMYERIHEAITAGFRGPLVDVDDGDDGVRISLE